MLFTNLTKSPSKVLLLCAACTSILLTESLIEFIYLTIRQFDLESGTEWWKQPSHGIVDRGDGYPETYTIPFDTVRLDVEESVHYMPEALQEWELLQAKASGSGYVRLGDSFRGFSLPMLHQMHCVDILREAILTGNSVTTEHKEHCINYIRQWILCRADMTLERGDFAKRDFRLDREGASHKCRDWRLVYSSLESNWNTWVTYWQEHKLWQNYTGDSA
ncbi:hypothetical protein CPC08DRAFT_823973 [Agrocybe pediades]|nr:hypothetical protein CPC08DRAFT_823973 [Agrocybe pediades]